MFAYTKNVFSGDFTLAYEPRNPVITFSMKEILFNIAFQFDIVQVLKVPPHLGIQYCFPTDFHFCYKRLQYTSSFISNVYNLRHTAMQRLPYVCVPGGKKCSFGVFCFLETPVFRFALLPYYGRCHLVIQMTIALIKTTLNIIFYDSEIDYFFYNGLGLLHCRFCETSSKKEVLWFVLWKLIYLIYLDLFVLYLCKSTFHRVPSPSLNWCS